MASMATPSSPCDSKEDSSAASTAMCTPVDSKKQDKTICDNVQGSKSDHWIRRIFSQKPSIARPHDEESTNGWQSQTRALESKLEGYDQLAEFQASDRNFLQYRGFRTLHCRVMSDLQYELESLEHKLDELDAHDRMDPDPNAGQVMLNCKRLDKKMSRTAIEGKRYANHITRTRPVLLGEIRTKLLEYDEMLLRTKEIMALPHPSRRDYTSLLNWLRQFSGIAAGEVAYIRRKEDIVTLRSGRESTGLDALVESCLGRLDDIMYHTFGSRCIQHIFLTPELQAKNRGGEVQYFSPARIDTLVNLIITIVVFVLLILPVVVMYEVTSIGRSQTPLDAIGVLIVFTMMFGMAISSLTTARRHELFAASAAYAAVLVVFIGNFGVQQVSILPAAS